MELKATFRHKIISSFYKIRFNNARVKENLTFKEINSNGIQTPLKLCRLSIKRLSPDSWQQCAQSQAGSNGNSVLPMFVKQMTLRQIYKLDTSIVSEVAAI